MRDARHLLRESDRGRKQFAFHDLVDQTDLKSRRSFDDLAGDQHLSGFRHSHKARQPLRSFRAGDDAEIGFGQSDLGVRDGDAIVRGHGQFESAAQRRAMDRNHNRFRGILDGGEQVMEVGPAAFTGCDRFREFIDIGARDEIASSAHDDDRRRPPGRPARSESPTTDFPARRAEGVHRRIINGDDGDVVPWLDESDGLRH